jgi:magnesium-protoporphyrin O-methyltransferase
MHTLSYLTRRGEIKTYFDRTAAQTWARLTSDAPLGRIRATVRAGRDRMRGLLLDWLPADLRGCRLLDAGCGTGALAVEAARRGADVVAIDLSPTLVDLARARFASTAGPGTLDFRVGDMLDPGLGQFDYVVAMDSLIHYRTNDMVRVLGELSRQSRQKMLVTYAPSTAGLRIMHAVGRLFPKADRAPSIEPVSQRILLRDFGQEPLLQGWKPARTERVSSGFYKSQALEIVRR